MACGNIWFKPRQCWLNDANQGNFYHTKPQRHKDEDIKQQIGGSLSSFLCDFAALRDKKLLTPTG
jgi:hypothetical protein